MKYRLFHATIRLSDRPSPFYLNAPHRLLFPVIALLLIPFATLPGCRNSEDSVLNLTRRAKALTEKKEYPEAHALLEQALEKDPTHIDAYLEQGRLYEAQNQIDDAIASYTKAISISPKHIAGNMILANAYRRAGNLSEAKKWVEKASSLAPGEAYIHHIYAALLFKEGNVEGAVASLRKAVSLKNDDGEFHLDLAKALEHTGEKEEAVKEYEKVIEIVSGLDRFREWEQYSQKRIAALRREE